MENIEVYTKYPVINNDWVLHKNPDDVGIEQLWGRSLGSEMMSVCLNANDVVDDVFTILFTPCISFLKIAHSNIHIYHVHNIGLFYYHHYLQYHLPS